jgi:Polysaccharide deacetylase
VKRHFRLSVVLLGFLLLAALVGGGALAANAAPTTKTPAPAIANIPVLVYHELNNGCAATVAVCNASDPESVSTTQMKAQLSYLHAQGYRTVNLTQYLAWMKGNTSGLPAKPLLITFDNGIGNLLQGAVPVLRSYDDTAVAFLVSGFADGAAGVCKGTPIAGQAQINTQPGCPVDNIGWDLTWSQLQALPTSVYQFALEAGPSGHFVQDYDPNCTQFYACKAPGETDAQYEARVRADQNTGLAEIQKHLKNVNTNGWVVPYSDLGYTECSESACTPQNHDGPANWLQNEAANKFQAAFVEDSGQNGVLNQRFRFDVQGWMTQAEFESTVTSYVSSGAFNG